ncbi:Phospholipase D alpha 1 [Glycine soja]
MVPEGLWSHALKHTRREKRGAQEGNSFASHALFIPFGFGKLMAQILLHGTLHATIYEVDKLKIGGGNNLTKIFEARETLEQRVVDAAVPGDQKGSKFFGVLHFEEFIRHLRLKVSNIMYLDSLAGVGLSYSKNTSKYATWDLETRLIPIMDEIKPEKEEQSLKHKVCKQSQSHYKANNSLLA